MADDHKVDSKNDDEEEAEEALSLSDLPLTTDIDEPAADEEEDMNYNINDDEEDKHPKKTTFHISSSSNCRSISSASASASSSSEPTSDLFEFFSDLSSEMSHAEDIIFRGKLKPFINNIDQQQYCSLSKQTTTTQQHNNNYYKPAASIINNNNNNNSVDDKRFHRRRSGSMSDLNISSTSRSNSTDLSTASRLLMRNSRSLDYQKLRRTTSSETSTSDQIQRNSSGKNIYCGKSSEAGQKLSRPRWHILMFGLLKFPPEMELRDIKKRQVRRNHSAVMFPTSFEDAGQKVPVNRSTDRKSSWGLLKVLSCKGNASVAVTASFGCMP